MTIKQRIALALTLGFINAAQAPKTADLPNPERQVFPLFEPSRTPPAAVFHNVLPIIPGQIVPNLTTDRVSTLNRQLHTEPDYSNASAGQPAFTQPHAGLIAV